MSRILLLLFACGCSVARPPAQPKPSGAVATVFVPGYKGSFLVDEHGERAWLNPEAAFTSGEESLALPFPGERARAAWGPLHPDGPLTRLSVLFIRRDVYLGFLEFAQKEIPGLVPFSYDWRRDIRESAAELCETIARLPVEQVDLVAHSMGGLVVLHCLEAGAPKVRRIVFAGTPFRGAAEIFKDLLAGATVGRNTSLLSKEATFSFPAAFQLLPPGGEYENPERWIRSGWGVFADARLRADPAYRAHLASMLAAHRRTRETVAKFRGTPGMLAVVGTGQPTVSAEHPRDLGHPDRADGDGTVLETSARLEGAEIFRTRARHEELLLDEDVQRAIVRFLGSGR